MARGWESKSVEEQQSEFTKTSGDSGNRPATPEDKKRAQRIQALQLARANVLNQLKASQSERYRQMLERELQDLEAEISRLAR